MKKGLSWKPTLNFRDLRQYCHNPLGSGVVYSWWLNVTLAWHFLHFFQRQLHVMDETYVINQVKEDVCYVSQDFYKDMQIAQ